MLEFGPTNATIHQTDERIGVEELRDRAEILQTRMGEFEAHDARNRAADDPRENREDQVQRPDVLVVGRHEPAGEEARLVVMVVMGPFVVGLEVFGGGSHDGTLVLLDLA